MMNWCLTFDAIYTFNINSRINQVNDCEVRCKLESLEGNKADKFMNFTFSPINRFIHVWARFIEI